MEQASTGTGNAEEHSAGKKLIISFAIVAFLLIVVLIWLYYLRPAGVPEQRTSGEEDSGVGAEIYEQSQNPVKDEIPEGGSPVANPVKDSYKNPFE